MAKSTQENSEKPAKKKPAFTEESLHVSLAELSQEATDSQSETDQEITIERRLVALYSLQQIDSQIDRIRIVRGELPLEVQDLEDEIAGLETRIENLSKEIESIQTDLEEKKQAIKERQALIKKYEGQQMNVRNNREYDALSKEIEFQNLEIQLFEKKINEQKHLLTIKSELLEKSKSSLSERKNDLELKKSELNDIVTETEKEESQLLEKSKEHQKMIEERLLMAYTRIRKNARNGLAVVKIERDACGGCFNKIPPQRQMDIKMHKKIIVCEYCGRILVDDIIEGMM